MKMGKVHLAMCLFSCVCLGEVEMSVVHRLEVQCREWLTFVGILKGSAWEMQLAKINQM